MSNHHRLKGDSVAQKSASDLSLAGSESLPKSNVSKPTSFAHAMFENKKVSNVWPPARICRNLAGLKMLVVFETANMEFAGNHVMNKQ